MASVAKWGLKDFKSIAAFVRLYGYRWGLILYIPPSMYRGVGYIDLSRLSNFPSHVTQLRFEVPLLRKRSPEQRTWGRRGHQETPFYCQGGWPLDQVAQRSRGVSIHGDVQSPPGLGPGPPALGCPAWAGGVNQVFSKGPWQPQLLVETLQPSGFSYSGRSWDLERKTVATGRCSVSWFWRKHVDRLVHLKLTLP